jgi:hypothetical protein
MIFFLFDCPRCGQKLKAEVGLVRPTGRCPSCSRVYRLPRHRKLGIRPVDVMARMRQFMSRSEN